MIELAITIGISRTNNIAVIVSPSVYASKAELDKVRSVMLTAVKVKVYDRDPNKPTYGFGESGGGGGIDQEVTLSAKTYTGLADVTLILNNEQYDAENMKSTVSGTINGDMIIEEG